MKRTTLIIGAIALLLIGFLWTGYNSLVTVAEGVDNAWADVESQYQRRADLIPNLVSTVKGAANFEQETFTEVTAARSQWQEAAAGDSLEAQVQAAQGLDSAIGRLLVTVEAYPQLQATQAFRDLQVQLEGTENRIATARRDYNAVVRDYNIRVKRFPKNMLAGLFGFDAAPFFEADEGTQDAPTVDFEQ